MRISSLIKLHGQFWIGQLGRPYYITGPYESPTHGRYYGGINYRGRTAQFAWSDPEFSAHTGAQRLATARTIIETAVADLDRLIEDTRPNAMQQPVLFAPSIVETMDTLVEHDY